MSEPLAIYEKDPEAILDYGIDWSRWLTEFNVPGLTIDESSWALATGIENEADDVDGSITLVRISGGLWGREYRVTNHIVASNGEEDDRTIVIRVEPR